MMPHLLVLHPGPRDARVHARQLCPQRRLGLQAHPWSRGISADPLPQPTSTFPPQLEGPLLLTFLPSLPLS